MSNLKLTWMQGKTLGYVAGYFGFRAKGWRVYTLADENDDTGTRASEDYDLRRMLRDRPELKECRVAAAEDYYGMLLLRVRREST